MLDHADPPRAERGHVADPRNPWRGIPGLGLAMTMCRDQPMDGPLTGLAHLTKRVPDDFVSKVCVGGRAGREAFVVKCQCGAWMVVPQRLTPCGGGCDRFFFADEYAAFAIRLPAQDWS